jgi:pyruvate formate-lyase/glycerol dehydratase family glycyl radical enzyme
MPTRARRYQDLVLTADYEICIERARHVTRAWRAHETDHPSLRAAHAFAQVAANATVDIHPLEGIVGMQTSKRVGTALAIERGDSNTILRYEIDGLLKRESQPYHIDPGDRAELFDDILPYWRGRTVRDLRTAAWRRTGRHVEPRLSPSSLLQRWRGLDLPRLREMVRSPVLKPLGALAEVRELTLNNPALVMNVFDVQGHLVLGNRNVLPGGFSAIRERATQRLQRCEAEGDEDGIAFCRGVILSCDAVRDWAGRYAARARQLAQEEPDGPRRDELLAIAERCDRVPFEPPRDFREAVQAVWFTEAAAVLAHGMTGIFATGRLDQTLWPWYERDRAQGRISRAEAQELLQELLVKLSSNLQLLPIVGKATGSELGADSMAVTVGGVGRDGREATNELSEIFLEAVAAVRGLGNTFSIRVSEGSSDDWLRRTAEVFAATSGPGIFCDEQVIDALHRSGCAIEDARDYAVIGCVEPTPDGNTFGCTSGNDLSLVGALEMALLRGHLRIMGRRVGPDTGDPRSFTTFDQLLEAFQRQVVFMIDTVAEGVRVKDRVYAEGFHNPYVSMTLDGCLDSARDMTCGGARYDFASISARGLGTTADSLAALQAAVFDRGQFTMAEVLHALARNFDGHEPMRQYLHNRTPKYGNDDAAADAIATTVASHFCGEVSSRRCDRGPYRPGFFSYGMHVLEGTLLGATPDGRRSGDPISNSLSPTNGVERNGPTGVMNSVARLDAGLISNGYSLNVKMLPSMLDTPQRRDRFAALIRGYFDQGGMEVQFNVVDDATLRDAQAHPDRYRDLVVRVSGYSAFFTDLGPAIQNEIISRTAFGEY